MAIESVPDSENSVLMVLKRQGDDPAISTHRTLLRPSTPRPTEPLSIRGKQGAATLQRPTGWWPVFIKLAQPTRHSQWKIGSQTGVIGNGKQEFTHLRVDWTDEGIVWRCYGPDAATFTIEEEKK